MLSNFTWKEYLGAALLLTAIYYLIIGLIYYRKELGQLVSRKSAPEHPEGEDLSDHAQEQLSVTEIPNPYHDASLDELEALLTDIKTNILERAGISADKGALLTELQARLAIYDGLRQPAYQDALTNYVMAQAKELCGVTFSADELRAAWKKVPR